VKLGLREWIHKKLEKLMQKLDFAKQSIRLPTSRRGLENIFAIDERAVKIHRADFSVGANFDRWIAF